MTKFVKILLIVCLLSAPALLQAQPPTFDHESPYGVTDVPFDDDVKYLVGIGLLYGIYRVWAYKKEVRNKKGFAHN
jgi:hypothetical protein